MKEEKYLLKLFCDYEQEMSAFTGKQPKTKKEIKKYISSACKGDDQIKILMEEGSFVIFQTTYYFKTNYFNYLIHLYVDPEKRRNGIATKLLESIKKPIILECYKKNEAALSCYKSMGFCCVRESVVDGVLWLWLGDPKSECLALYVTEIIDKIRYNSTI